MDIDETIECECGWKGQIKDLYHRNDSGWGWWCDQHECPKCFEVKITSSGEKVYEKV
jgi:hypothetical protein